MNNEFDKLWKGDIAASSEVQCLHAPEETKKNPQKLRIIEVSAKIRIRMFTA
jgi:hypothetical protein